MDNIILPMPSPGLCYPRFRKTHDTHTPPSMHRVQAELDEFAEELSAPPVGGLDAVAGWAALTLPEPAAPRIAAQRAVRRVWAALRDACELLNPTTAGEVGRELVLGLASCFQDLAKDGLPAQVSPSALRYARLDCALVSACAPALLRLCAGWESDPETAADLASTLEEAHTSLRARDEHPQSSARSVHVVDDLIKRHPLHAALVRSAPNPLPAGA